MPSLPDYSTGSLGILSNDDGAAVRMLGRMGISPEMVEERISELRGRADG
jgi:hypothetical protein